MQICRFIDAAGQVHYGLRDRDSGDVRVARGCPFSGTFEATDEVADVQRLACPTRPKDVIAIGKNYAEHVAEMAGDMGEDLPDHPLVFAKLTSCVIGPREPIIIPPEAPDQVDYEAELAIIIGRTCRNVSEQEALDHVLGYTCANDVTARDCQYSRDRQWTRAKSFDTFGPLGPWIETDLDPSDLAVRLTVNDKRLQDGRTSQMIFKPAELISYLSRQFTLRPMTVILTGTPSGVGAKRNPPRWLAPGDEVTVEVEGIGSLINPVVSS
jgi:2-keto-4-pentenoate hydratase/2-oxohepta-3-ene-1,7-dioic acid hydratase in catechol pathway